MTSCGFSGGALLTYPTYFSGSTWSALYPDPLGLFPLDVLTPPVVKLGDASAAKGGAAHLIGVEAGVFGSPFDHMQDVIWGKTAAGGLASAPVRRLKEWRVLVAADAGGAQIRVGVYAGFVVDGNVPPLTALFLKVEFPAVASPVVVGDVEAGDG